MAASTTSDPPALTVPFAPADASVYDGHLVIIARQTTYIVCHDDVNAIITVANQIKTSSSTRTSSSSGITTIMEVALRMAALRKIPRVWMFGRRVLLTDGTNISKIVLLGTGVYGKVYLLPYFNIVVKLYHEKVIWTAATEIAMYSLIATAYAVPEEKGLPSLLGYGDTYLFMPYYGSAVTADLAEGKYKDIAYAIYNLHALGVLHRDIKHDNFLYVEKPCPGWAPIILIDFGLSNWNVVVSNRPRLTQVQARNYRSPEAALSDEQRLSFAADVWSFGMIMTNRMGRSITISEDADVIPRLTSLFGLKKQMTVKDLQKNCYPICEYYLGEARDFLNLSPLRRRTLASYLLLPEITSEFMATIVPTSEEIFSFSEAHVIRLTYTAGNWIAYFAAMIYMQYLDRMTAQGLANLLFGGETVVIPSSELYRLQGRFIRHNLYTLLLTRYPHKEPDFVRHCFILTFHGVEYPHEDMAQWIADYFGYTSKGQKTYPHIERLYLRNCRDVQNCKEILGVQGLQHLPTAKDE